MEENFHFICKFLVSSGRQAIYEKMPNIHHIKVDDYEARNKTKPKEIVPKLFIFLAFEENGENVSLLSKFNSQRYLSAIQV